jgi:hypothetical protein
MDKPKYSILVGCYDPDGRLVEMTAECIKLILQHSKGKDFEILMDPDVNETGWAGVYNRLMKRANGDYLVFCANDVMIDDDNWLDNLAVPGTIASPHLNPFVLTGELQSFATLFCMPREIQEKIGFIDEQFKDGYGYDDNDFFHRANLLNIPQKEVPISFRHRRSGTYLTYWDQEQHQTREQRNRSLFKEKWGI